MTELRVQLRDGTPVWLRPVLPEDRDRLQNGLLMLSSESRYFRFFSPMPGLTDEQLRYFTEVDQENHVAWIALDPSLPGLPGIGIARFVRMQDQSAMAEVALVVIDTFQRRGLATALLAALYLMAQAKGVRTLRAFVLPENRTVIDWLHRLGAAPKLYRDGMVEVDLTVHRDISLLPRTPTGEQFRKLMAELRSSLGKGVSS